MMVMIWVSPYTSLERNAGRDRALSPSIVVKTWAGVNANIGTYEQTFGDKFVLINNDPTGKAEYDPAYAKKTFFQTVKGSGKVYTPDEKAKREMIKTFQAIGGGNIAAWGGVPAAMVIGSFSSLPIGFAVSWGVTAILYAAASAIEKTIDKNKEE